MYRSLSVIESFLIPWSTLIFDGLLGWELLDRWFLCAGQRLRLLMIRG